MHYIGYSTGYIMLNNTTTVVINLNQLSHCQMMLIIYMQSAEDGDKGSG